MKRKRGFTFSFAWIFAILAGAFILFLAIYFAVNLVTIEKTRVDTETAKQIVTLLHPLETSAEAGKVDYLELRTNTRLYNDCYAEGLNENAFFGENRVSLSEISLFSKKWSEPNKPGVASQNYIFSEKVIEGEKIYVLAERIKMPFDLADAMSLYSGEYCFVNPPDSIIKKIKGLKLEEYNVNISREIKECSQNSNKVCFSYLDSCDIIVNGLCTQNCEDIFDMGSIEKRDSKGEVKKIYYTGELFFAGIFSDPDTYECNLQRIMVRLSQTCKLLKDKSLFIMRENCVSGLEGDLINLMSLADNLESSAGLFNLNYQARILGLRNIATSCKLY